MLMRLSQPSCTVQEGVPEEQAVAFRGFLWRSAATAAAHLQAKAHLTEEDVAKKVGRVHAIRFRVSTMHYTFPSHTRNSLGRST